MKTLSVLDMLAIAISVPVLLASSYLFYMTPARRWQYGLAFAVLCAGWIARRIAHAGGRADPALQAARREITLGILLAGALLAAALLVPLGWSPGAGFSERSTGVLMGVIVVAFANVIPKQASPRGLKLRRTAGWALVLGGLGYSLAWLALPLAYANTAALLSMLLGLTYAVARITWLLLKQRSVPHRPG